mmetsp:Transcript_19608/g.59308  ORF Transcript_19608/g.59308 Transcript_19608/m.59308 type:complete len:237 (-) Transcript_19608:1495-2205(-)
MRSSPPSDLHYCSPSSRRQSAMLWPLPCLNQHAIPQPPPYRIPYLSSPVPQPPQLWSVIRGRIRWAWRGRGTRFLPMQAPRLRRLRRSLGRRSGGWCAAPCVFRLPSSSSSCSSFTGPRSYSRPCAVLLPLPHSLCSLRSRPPCSTIPASPPPLRGPHRCSSPAQQCRAHQAPPCRCCPGSLQARCRCRFRGWPVLPSPGCRSPSPAGLRWRHPRYFRTAATVEAQYPQCRHLIPW